MKKIILGFVTLIIIVFVLNSKSYKTVKKAIAPSPSGMVAGEQTENKKTVSVVLDFGKGNTATYSAENSATALAALEEVTKQNNISLFINNEYSFGKFVETIGEQTKSKEKSWMYYVNGKAADVGADQYELENGDIVEWKYVKI